MNTLEVVTLSFNQLTDAQAAVASNNGQGKEYANYLCVLRNGEPVFFESDAMEPEDVRFTRDLKWIKEAIEYAYQCGMADGQHDPLSSLFPAPPPTPLPPQH